MPIQFDPEFKQAFNDRNATKMLATSDANGEPHVTLKGSLHINDDDQIVLLEVNGQSATNGNLVRSRQTGRRVAINVRTTDNRSFLIKGKPVQAITAGPVFESHLRDLRQRRPDANLSTVWLIEPGEIEQKGAAARAKAEAQRAQ